MSLVLLRCSKKIKTSGKGARCHFFCLFVVQYTLFKQKFCINSLDDDFHSNIYHAYIHSVSES